MQFSLPLLALASSLLPAALAATPGACTGACWTHDPSIIRAASGTYYRFSTGTKLLTMSAPALSGPWTQLGSALPAGSSIALTGADDLWAPDVSLIDGTYYLLYSVSTFGSQASAIGVATSAGELGPGGWTDHGSTGIESEAGDAFNAIDGNMVVDGNTAYVAYGSFWADIFVAPMVAPPLSAAGGDAVNVAFNATGSQALEGPFVFPKDGAYFLFFSSGVCCGLDATRPAAGEEYKIMVCKASAVTGPYTDAEGRSCVDGSNGGTLVLGSGGTTYAPGGQGVLADEGGDVLYYHYVDTDVGYADGDKLFGWNLLDWSSGWPVPV
ncbi:endo-alpha-1,5-arabinanase [Geopyxis carbonaria]|nr:endo-alpha-1,5-arabinanase [Geopyxis carbonaria]